MNIELKPCPFCGGEPRLVEEISLAKVACMNRGCYVEPETPWFWSVDEAAEAWNTRTPPSDWREARELLDATYQPDSGNLTAAYLAGLADGKAMKRTCRIVKKWSDSDYVDGWRYRCSECMAFIPVNEREPETGDVISAANFCPNCGAKVVEE